MLRRLVVAALVAIAAIVAAAIFVATSPHPWAGELLCELGGGEWKDGFDPHADVVTNGFQCVE